MGGRRVRFRIDSFDIGVCVFYGVRNDIYRRLPCVRLYIANTDKNHGKVSIL